MKRIKKIASVLMLAATVVLAAGCTKPDEPNNGENNGNGNDGGGDTPEVPTVPTGAIDGAFTINENGGKVYFSQGNLQYQASTNTFRFAENQWNFIGGSYEVDQMGNVDGSDNCLISNIYNGWIDLFGYGTSGWNGGGYANFQPYVFSSSPDGFLDKDLAGEYAKADWGVYNAISNGGNQPGLWRTLTRDEWEYVINGREGSRWCTAIVNGVKGAILIPDGWDNTAYTLDRINDWRPTTTSNIIDQSTWESTCEPAGLVFLPNTGCRKGYAYWATDHYNTYVSLDLSEGYGNYWASSVYREYQGENTSSICMMTFSYGESGTPSLSGRDRPNGIAVRLVQEVQ